MSLTYCMYVCSYYKYMDRIQWDRVLLRRWRSLRLLAEGVKLLAMDSEGER